ncbi:hypothetical protein L3Q82_001768 [Scortum barcoo]|uniref:Uncharacterized protein n=1 Tax=Scortum barcoo TaxID=214431 RepID=A0ACB8W4P4_9TELE|nr:hypothetical protein L3Q82_001768 [Scortum barcoo]
MFFFSSAFNTIQPALLNRKLLDMQVDAPLMAWIHNYLTGQPQYVRLGNITFGHHCEQHGGARGQGTVLSPLLFTLYTSDFRFFLQSCHLQKFSDDSAIVGCISRGQEEENRSVVDRFVEWCGLNHLQLSVTKTMELVVDFRKQRTRLNAVIIRGTEVDIVDSYKYLGVHLDNKLDWTINTDAIYKKGQSARLLFLRRLRSFNVCRTMLQIFYHSMASSIIFYSVVCWGSRLKTANTNRLNKLIRRAGSVLGVELESVVEVSERRMLRKLLRTRIIYDRKFLLDRRNSPIAQTPPAHLPVIPGVTSQNVLRENQKNEANNHINHDGKPATGDDAQFEMDI